MIRYLVAVASLLLVSTAHASGGPLLGGAVLAEDDVWSGALRGAVIGGIAGAAAGALMYLFKKKKK